MAITIILMALATWRLANMLADTNQSGPFDMLDWLRSKLGVRFDQMSQPYGSNSLSKGLLCIYCNSVWFGTAYTLVYLLSPDWALYLSLPLALSAAAILLEKVR